MAGPFYLMSLAWTPPLTVLSSGRNYFLYHHATKAAYSQWANEVGDPSYEYDSLLPYLQRSVQFTPANNSLRAPNASYTYSGSAFSPTGGPLQVTLGNAVAAPAS